MGHSKARDRRRATERRRRREEYRLAQRAAALSLAGQVAEAVDRVLAAMRAFVVWCEEALREFCRRVLDYVRAAWERTQDHHRPPPGEPG